MSCNRKEPLFFLVEVLVVAADFLSILTNKTYITDFQNRINFCKLYELKLNLNLCYYVKIMFSKNGDRQSFSVQSDLFRSEHTFA